jgi:hypothetical protein
MTETVVTAMAKALVPEEAVHAPLEGCNRVNKIQGMRIVELSKNGDSRRLRIRLMRQAKWRLSAAETGIKDSMEDDIFRRTSLVRGHERWRWTSQQQGACGGQCPDGAASWQEGV